MGRAGVESDEFCFDAEDTGIAGAELVEVADGAALISEIGDTTLFPAAPVEIAVAAEELAGEKVAIGASSLEIDPAVVDGSGPLPSTVIHCIEQSSSSDSAIEAPNATAKNMAKTKEVFMLTNITSRPGKD